MTGSPAMALDCSRIPGARIDLDLSSLASSRDYGRLYPEFKTEQKSAEFRRAVHVDRLVGRRLVLDDGGGEVILQLTEEGTTDIIASLAGRDYRRNTRSSLTGLNNASYNGQLAQAFFALGIVWKDYQAPPLSEFDFSRLPDHDDSVRVGQTTLQLAGIPLVERDSKIDYACSDRASFVGDPADLSTMVVLKGTIRASQLTVTTTTERILDLTINDIVERQTASRAQLRSLLSEFPELVSALSEPVAVAEAQQPSAKALQSENDKHSEDSVAAVPGVPAASTTPPAGDTPPPAPSTEPASSWGPVLTALAVICTLLLLFLYHPRFTARRQRDSVAASAAPEAETDATEETDETQAADMSEDEAESGETEPDKPEIVHTPAPMAPAPAALQDGGTSSTSVEEQSRRLETRIAVLNDLQAEAEKFQTTLAEAISTAATDAADTKRLKDQLAKVSKQLDQVSSAKSKLEEAAQDARSRLTAAQDEARELKELVVDLRTRLAKANARIEASESVIVELEAASKMAIELNADYRAKSQDARGENRALRSRVALLETSLSERDDLLSTTNMTNEEIAKALLDERLERASLEEDFQALSKDFEALQQEFSVKVKQANSDVTETDTELKSVRDQLTALEEELESANESRKQAELDAHAKQADNARLRVDHGVRTKLLENNVQELSAHIDQLEQLLRDADMDVPELALTPLTDEESRSTRSSSDSADIVRLNIKR